MRLLSLCLPLLCLGFNAAAQDCQSIPGQALQAKIVDDPNWNFVDFSGYVRTAPVPSGVDCMVHVGMGGPGAIGVAPAGFFEGVAQSDRMGFRSETVVRELDLQPALGAGDEIDLYELGVDAGDGSRQELLVRLIADSGRRGTIYVLRLVYAPGDPLPKVDILLESGFRQQGGKVQCMGELAPICLSVAYNGTRRSNQLAIRLSAADGIVEKSLMASNPPTMRMGFLGGLYRSGQDSGVRMRHKVCQIDENILLGSCSFSGY